MKNVEASVSDRYGKGAQAVEAALCCPTNYDPKFLEVIPQEVIERDYGCGDPSQYLEPGETVLDLGSGTGKICFIASQVVGAEGHVIGVDMTDEMLLVAREAVPVVAERIGFENVEFRKGRIQDLRTDRDWMDGYLREQAITDEVSLREFEEATEKQRQERPLVADNSVDVVVSNCVLNLVRNEDKAAMFQEIFRVLKRGGRAVISDIVSDEDVPQAMQDDPELWSGCISGALREDAFLKAFEDAGFYGVMVLERQVEPWQVENGLEFRSMTLVAYKGKQGECWERYQAVMYKGPFSQVHDDDGHVYYRGQKMAVCDKTFQLLKKSPYADSFEFIEPADTVALADAKPFPCDLADPVRSAAEIKGAREVDGIDSGTSGCC